MINFKKMVLGPLENNFYIVWNDRKEGAIIDTPPGIEKGLAFIEKEGIDIKFILMTHDHFDHTLGLDIARKELPEAKLVVASLGADNFERQKTNPPTYLEKSKMPQNTKVDIMVKDGDILKLGDDEIEVILAPGHTVADTAFKIGDYLFTGDTLFAGTIGRCDLEGGNYEQLLASIAKFLRFSGDTKVCPGHGPDSTIAHEDATNPYYNGLTDED